MTSLSGLPVAFRALFSSFLVIVGIGYLTALSLLYFVDIEPHKKLGQGLVQGISQNYHGAPRGTRLRAALMGPMAKKLSAEERSRIFQWMDKGALEDDFASVEPIFSAICSDCHSPEKGLPIPPLTNYAEVARVVRKDPGPSISQLARVSHIHLFGISIIFLLTGAIFSLSDTPIWLRSASWSFPMSPSSWTSAHGGPPNTGACVRLYRDRRGGLDGPGAGVTDTDLTMGNVDPTTARASCADARRGPGVLERDDFSSNFHPGLSFCLSMISAQTRSAFVAREKPVSTFPDHAPGAGTAAAATWLPGA